MARAASVVGMSPSHFRRFFKQTMGRSYVRYLHAYRIERACELMTISDRTLCEIAVEVGFCDQSYFGLVFRRVRSQTPAAFRRELYAKPGDWFVVHTYSGMENRVRANLENRISSLHMEDYIHEIVVPTEEVAEIKNGQRKMVKRTVLPASGMRTRSQMLSLRTDSAARRASTTPLTR